MAYGTAITGLQYVAGTKRMRIAATRALARVLASDYSNELIDTYITPEDFRSSLDSTERDLESHMRRLQGRRMVELGRKYIDGDFTDTTKRIAVLMALQEIAPADEMAKEGRYRKRLSAFKKTKEDRKRTGEAISRIWSALPQQEKMSKIEGLIRASGGIPWSREETELFESLLSDPSYTYQKGSHRGHPDYPRIKIELDTIFGNNRSKSCLKTLAYNMRKSKVLDNVPEEGS